MSEVQQGVLKDPNDIHSPVLYELCWEQQPGTLSVAWLWRRPPANLTVQAEAWSKLAEVCVWTEERP